MLLIGIVCALLASSITTAQNTPALCSQSNSMSFNADQLNGTWWEVARNPAPAGNWDCVKVEFIVQPNNALRIETTYSNTPSYLWVNQTMFATISLDAPSGSGYNFSYVSGISNTPYIVYKLLNTDYTNYAFICGYSNATDVNTSFGIVLTRNRFPSTATLNTYEETASELYASFTNGTMAQITQSPTCYYGGAHGLGEYSIVATLLAVVHAFVHFAM